MLKGIRKARAACDKALTPPFSSALLLKAIQLCGQVGYIQADTRYNECVVLQRKVEVVERVRLFLCCIFDVFFMGNSAK